MRFENVDFKRFYVCYEGFNLISGFQEPDFQIQHHRIGLGGKFQVLISIPSLKTTSCFYFAGKMLGWDTEEAENVW